MREQGERIARLETQVERMEQLEIRIGKLEIAVYRAFGGLAVLTIGLQITIALIKH